MRIYGVTATASAGYIDHIGVSFSFTIKCDFTMVGTDELKNYAFHQHSKPTWYTSVFDPDCSN